MATVEPGAEDLASAFLNVATILSQAATVEEVLHRIVGLSIATIEPCDFAGVMARDGGRTLTLAASEAQVRTLDQLQLDTGEGPCLDVLSGSLAHYIPDLETDVRWPRFSAQAVQAGVRSVLALQLGEGTTPAALNLYAQLPHAYGPTDRAKGTIFATHAGVVLREQRQLADDAVASDQLRRGLATREVIGQAQGILMERERISARQAFEILRQASQHLNVKLRDVAQRLVDTGEDPETS